VRGSPVVPEADIWRAAVAMTERYGGGAMLEATARAERLLEAGDWQTGLTWHRIHEAIERLQAKTPSAGEAKH
jgi:hypothetical protein